MRICGDYKVTVNPVLKVKEHPLPKPDELFMKLNGGQKFTKLDMSHAYQQVLLEEKSREYVCRYKRPPFGISSATAIFHETMEKILSGLQRVAIYVDDLLVTGTTYDEHVQNLDKVLDKLSQWGIRLKKSKC